MNKFSPCVRGLPLPLFIAEGTKSKHEIEI